MKVVWLERFRFGLAPAPQATVDDILRFRKSYAAIPFEVTQTVARSLNIEAGQIVLLPQEPGSYLFHFWGTVWGELLTAVLVAQGIGAEPINEYCLFIRQPINQLPAIDETIVTKAARDIIVTMANRLEMGRFQRLLPVDVATTATLNLLNLPQFGQLYQTTKLINRPQILEQLALLAQSTSSR
jgi:hypothetical protein